MIFLHHREIDRTDSYEPARRVHPGPPVRFRQRDDEPAFSVDVPGRVRELQYRGHQGQYNIPVRGALVFSVAYVPLNSII